MTMKYALILFVVLLWLSCSKPGGTTPVPTPPKDTVISKPPVDTTHTDTTHTGTTGTGTDTTRNPQARNFIAMDPLFNLFIADNGVYIERLDDGGMYDTITGRLNTIQTDTRLGTSVSQRFTNPGNALPTLTTDKNGDLLLDYTSKTNSSYEHQYADDLRDTTKYLNFQFTVKDTTYVVFPIGMIRLRNFPGTPRTCDSILHVMGNTPTALDGIVNHL